MAIGHPGRAMSISERVYSLLLLAYPRAFRDRYATDMLRTFRDDRRLTLRRGRLWLLPLWMSAVGDLARNAVTERWSSNAPGSRLPLRGGPNPSDGSGMSELISTLVQDLRYAVRTLVKRPAFTVVAVATLALGIGANSAIFSIVNGVLLQPPPYGDPDRLVAIVPTYGPTTGTSVSTLDFLDLRDQTNGFSGAAAADPVTLDLTGGTEPERVAGALVTPDLFSVMGVPPLHGRTLVRGDSDGIGRAKRHEPAVGSVAVLGHRLWRRRFGGDPDIVGRVVRIGGRDTTIVGIAPDGFDYPAGAEVWLPLRIVAADEGPGQRGAIYLKAIARLAPGVTFDQAQVAVRSVGDRLAREYPDTNEGRSVTIARIHDFEVHDVRVALLILLSAVALVLLIACANVANLMLARGVSRRTEIAVRTALGAGRNRILRQLLTETVLLSLAGGAAGLLMAGWILRLLVAFGPEDLPHLDRVSIDMTVLAFTFGVSVVTGVLFGLVPAIQSARSDLNRALAEGSRGTSAPGHGVRSVLVVAEVALALVLLVSAGLLLRSFARLQQVQPGLDPSNVLTASLALPNARYPQLAQTAGFYRDLVDRLKGRPGVRDVGAILGLPLVNSARKNGSFELLDVPAPPDDPIAGVRVITPDYFRTIGLALKRGRAFSDRDDATAPPVAIINEAAARRYWPGIDAVGKRLRMQMVLVVQDETPREIVGIVADVHSAGLDQAPQPEIYLPHPQHAVSTMSLVLKTEGDPMALAADLRSTIRGMDPDLPLSDIRTMEQVMGRSVAQQRFNTTLLASFAGIALLLALIGIYGVLSFIVGQRTREIAVRMALGAKSGDVLRLVIGQGLKLAAMGICIGVVVALMATRTLHALLFGIESTDPVTFFVVGATLAAVAALASYVPAARAARTDPVTALRGQ